MANLRSLLNDVWVAFRKAGITDDVAIIGQVADMLLKMEGKPSPLSASSYKKSDLDRTFIESLLHQALAQITDAGDLFDRYILFRLDKMLPGGRYPTPRHIVKYMVNMAQIEPAHSLADFACGTGGFLVHANWEKGALRQGVEISPEWANLALANAILHSIEPKITFGNSLREFSTSNEQLFDRVLMNPPFGEGIDADLAEKAAGFATGSSSETALTALVLKSLTPDGKMAVLVPSGVLQNSSKGEKELRVKLLDNYTLEAVVTFSKDAFQPFSTLTTHLLLASNAIPSENALTWFFKPGYDGYDTGRGRDLTREPELPNDLWLVEKLFQTFHQPVTYDDKHLHVTKVENGGFIIRAAPASRLLSARYYDVLDQVHAFVLITTQWENSQTNWQVSLEDGSLTPVTRDLESFLKDYYKKPTKDQPKPAALFQNQADKESLGEILALAPDGKRLMGVAVPQATLRERYYSLDPEQYLKAPVEEVALRPPFELLQGIRESQFTLSQRIDNLLGWVVPSGGAPKLPSPVAMDETTLIGHFNPKQQEIWDEIQKFKEDILVETGEPYPTGKYFTPESDDLEKFDSTEVQMTLDILEKMGLIVLVTQKNPLTNDRMAFYRLTEERDEWKPESQTENQGEAQ